MTKSERTPEDSFWLDRDTSRVGEEPDAVPHYDLEERTARFDQAIIDFAKRIPRGPLTDRIIDQLVTAETSVGANYIEADDSVSKKEFLKCIGYLQKRSTRNKTFLSMVARAVPELQTDARKLWLEARALHLIFARIWRTGKQSNEAQ
jgi:four helix bundle protein